MNGTLTRAQRALMDLLAAHPDWTDEQLAAASNRSVSAVEKLLAGARARYGVRTRTGATVAHLRRRAA